MNLVNELQESAEKDDVLTVLRKTKRLASKLDRQDILDWLKAEMEGYPEGVTPPNYREIGIRFAFNSNGYIPAGYGMVYRGIQDIPNCPSGLSVKVGKPISIIMNWIESLNAGQELYFEMEDDEDDLIRSYYQPNPEVIV